MTIYIDVLLIVNIYVDYFILKITGKLLRLKIKQYRYFLSAFLGSFSSFIIFFPEINFLINIILMIAFSMIMVFCSFGKCCFCDFLKRTLVMFAVYFIFSGFIGFVCSEFEFIVFKNFVLYADISIITIIFCTTVVYFIISAFQYIYTKKNFDNADFDIYIKYNNQTVALKALGDTGNSLVDTISGKPIIICNENFLPISYTFKSKLKELNIENISQFIKDKEKPNGFKIISFSTINSYGLLPLFSPDEVIIKTGNRKYENIDALIGISTVQNKEYNAIFNPKILI